MRSLSAGTTSIQVVTNAARYYGYTVQETAGAAAQIIIHNGVAPADPVLATINLAANESANDWPAAGGVEAAGGIFIERVSGECELAVYYTT